MMHDHLVLDRREQDAAAGRESEGPSRAPRLSRLAVPVICLAQLMATLDVTIVNLALPSIQGELGLGAAEIAWVIDSYTLAYAGLLLVGGRAGDLFGRRLVLMAGVAVFTAASLLAGLAASSSLLLVARAGQGVGAALATPTTLSMITTLVPAGRERTRAMVAYGAMAGLGITLGLVLGGMLAEAASWRWVFWLNVPLGLAVLGLARRVIPETRGPRRRLDLLGAGLGTAALSGLVFGVIRGGEHGWSDPLAAAALGGALTGLLAFLAVETHVAEPTLPLPLLRHPVRLGAYLVAGLLFGCLYPAFLLLSRTLQQVHGHAPIAAGLRFLPIGAGVLILAVVARRIMPRTGPHPLVLVGALATAAGTGGLVALSAADNRVLLLLALAGLGAGVGTTFVANAAVSMTNVSDLDAGIASGLLSTVQAVGGTIGVAVLAAAATARTERDLAGDPSTPLPTALMSGFHDGFVLAALVAAAAVVCAALSWAADHVTKGSSK